jgi:hypothetical protein
MAAAAPVAALALARMARAAAVDLIQTTVVVDSAAALALLSLGMRFNEKL